jgi:flagellar M-ring protein FliF
MNRVNELVARARTMMAGFTLGQRAVVVVAALGLVLGAVALGRWAAQPTWTPLFSNLSSTDASAIVTELKAENVKYEFANDGTTILVPQAQVYDLRIAMAGKGLGASGNGSDNSWSVLDKQGMTTTDFQQNVAYQRAIEAELGRTLQAITGVNTAIVHLAIPKKDVFTTDADQPTASVLLQLAPGTTLNRSQIRSVMRLVANAVPGLNASDVTISDSDGNQLSIREDGAAGAAAAASETDQQTQAFEDARTATLQKMLDSVLGKGKAVVRVNAELNFDSNDTTAKTYVTASGSPIVGAEATSSESYSGGAGNGGLMGVTYPSLSPGAGGGGVYNKVQATRNYQVGEVVSETKASPGNIKRLSVAVVLDDSVKANVPAVQEMITQGAGLDTRTTAQGGRGDQLTVSTLKFDTTASAAAAKELKDAQSAAKQAQYIDLGKKAGGTRGTR